MTNSMKRPVQANRMSRGGMTLIEVVIAITILSLTMLGLANFTRIFQHSTSDTTMMALGSDLAIARIEEVKGWRVYSTLVATYGSTSETFTTLPYKGFTRTTKTVICSGCPTATNDYVLVTVRVTGNNLSRTIAKTTAIAKF